MPYQKAAACYRLDATILNEIFNKCRMHFGIRRQLLKSQLLGLEAAEDDVARGTLMVVYPFVSSRGLKCDAAASCSNKARSLSVRVGGLTNVSLTY